MRKFIPTGRTIKQIIVISCFVAVNFLLVSLLSKIFYEFNSGADRSKLLHIDLKQNRYYQPKVNFDHLDTEGREPNKENIVSIREDYLRSWYVRKYAFKSNNLKAFEDFYTDSAQAKIKRSLLQNIKDSLSIHSTSTDHEVHIKFFSKDGTVVYLEDNGVKERSYFFKKDQFLYQQNTVKDYRVIMLLEDGFWRIRHLVSSKKPHKSKKKNTEIDSLKASVDNTDKFTIKKDIHIVKPKENIYRLTLKHKLTRKQLYALNPDKQRLEKDLLYIGDTIVVKKSKVKIPKEPTEKVTDSIQSPTSRILEGYDIKGINYYPQKNPWFEFWKQYDSITVKKDFRIIKELNLNSIRIFIPYELFGKENVSRIKMEHLIKTLDIAYQNQLKVIVTFFDFYSNYDVLDYTLCDRHIDKIITQIKDHPAVFQYDIKNEPDLDFKIHTQTKVVHWLAFISERMRIYDPKTPITIGWYSPEKAHLLKDNVDYISFHYYKKPETFKDAFLSLKEKVDKPIVIQEFGKHSYNSIWNLYRNSEKRQANYYKDMQKLFNELDVKHFVSWTLYDFPEIDSDVFGKLPHKVGPQKNYGFITVDGKRKKAIKYIADYKE